MDLIRSKSRIINFKQIWDKQKISDELATFIEKVALHVSDFFNDAPNQTLMKNIAEYAKTEDCWIKLSRSKDFEFNENEIRHFSISLEESAEINSDNRTNQRENSTLSELIKINSSYSLTPPL